MRQPMRGLPIFLLLALGAGAAVDASAAGFRPQVVQPGQVSSFKAGTGVDPTPGAVQHVSIAVPSDGRPVIAVTDVAGNKLRLIKCTDAECVSAGTSRDLRSATSIVGTEHDVALKADGYPIVVYRAGFPEDRLRFAACLDAECSQFTGSLAADQSFLGNSLSLVIGTDARPVLSTGNGMGFLTIIKCADAECSGGKTLNTPDGALLSSTGFGSSIALGSDGNPVISYRAGNELRLARCTTADCAGAAMITPLASGLSDAEKQKPTSIAMGADGFPLVLYAGTIGTAITLVDCGDADCLARTSVPIDTVASSAELTLKLDAAGLPAIAYPDLGASSFTIARCTEQDCSGTIHYCRLSASEPIGRYSDMDVGSDGFPIAVYDSSTGPGILRCTDRVFLDGFEGT